MAAPVPLRWQAAAMPRAKLIAPEDWAAHEAEIRKLYERTTLDEMMKAMKDSHGFKPTRRQYIHQLDKWGIRKYGRKDVKAIPGSERRPVQFRQFDCSITDALVETKAVSKRHGSFQSTGSQDSEYQPPTFQDKKRLRHTLKNSPVSSGVELLRAPEHQNTIPVLPVFQPPENSSSTTSATSLRGGLYDDSNFEVFIPCGLGAPRFEECIARCVIEATKAVTLRYTHLYPALKIATEAKEHREKGRQKFLEQYDRQQILDAAEYLFASLLKEEAFDIYATLLGMHEANGPLAEELPLLMACARSSRLQSQCQFAQAACLKRLQGSSGKAMSSVDRFLAHMLIAECYTAPNSLDDAGKYLEEAKTSLRNFRTLTACQLNDTPKRLVYLYHKRYLMRNIEANQREAGSSLKCFDAAKIVSHGDFVRFATAVFHRSNLDLPFLEKRPSTSSPESTSSSYTRYGISLCQMAFESFGNPQFSGFSWALTTHWDWKYIRWAETLALFTHVWTEWQGFYCSMPVNQSWTRQLKKHIGISSTEALSIFCEMINLATPWDKSTTYSSLLRRFKEGLALLRGLSDEDLETKFLQLWYARTFRVHGAEQYAAFLGPPPQFMLSPLQRIPNTTATVTEDEQHRRHRSHTPVVSSVYTYDVDPTLAPSCRSSDSSYQRFRDTASSARYRIGSTIHSSDDLPSRTSSRSRNARPSTQVSQLSELMRSQIGTMSITEHPTEDASPFRSGFI